MTDQDLVAKARENLEAMQATLKRQLVEDLDVCVKLTDEDEQAGTCARRLLGQGVFLTSRTTHDARQRANNRVALTMRILLDECTGKAGGLQEAVVRQAAQR